LVDADATRIEIGLSDLDISSWGADFGKFHNMDLSILADTALAVPMLTELVKDRLAGDHDRQGQIASRAADLAERHRLLRAGWLADAREDWDATPMTTGRLALEVWEAIKNEDWVLTAGTLEGRVLKLWDFDRPYRHPGERLGPGTQIGISLGVALAHKGSGRLVVDLQPDGDLLYNTSALWTLARYEIPLLIVMFNNRAYYNDWEHQIEIAKFRGTPVGRAGVGQDIRDPDPDFAGMARSMGIYAEGPIEDPKELGPALERAIAQVMQGRPALVDAITRFR
jgi:acetolactate synthase-1/2/3 large subunit